MIRPTAFRSDISRLYAATVIGAGSALAVWRFPTVPFEHPVLFSVLAAGSLVLSASKVTLPLVRGHATLSMSYFTDILSLVLLGPDQGMLIAGASGATQCLLHVQKPNVTRTVFSVATLVIAMQVAGVVSSAFGGFGSDATVLALARVTLAAATAFFLVNSWLVATAVALTRRDAIVRTWYDSFFYTAPACFIGAAAAVLLARTPSAYLWVPALAAGPLYATFAAYRLYLGRLARQQQHVNEISALHLASVEALARAIDARDQTIDQTRHGDNHLRRVQAWAMALAEAAGMDAQEVEAVKIAALLHDIGKLAVPEHILTKPGPLTPKEFARVRIHPIVGSEIIKAVPFPYPVAPIVRSHHERWDGSGYPDGLRGSQTPIGARVLAVVDHFDALTSSRPYHAAAERAEAIAILEAEAGRALDPSLVTLFLDILPTLEQALPDGACGKTAAAAADDRSAAASAPRDGHAPTASWVFHNIALATQEMQTLHDIAQMLGTRLSVDDTMALLTAKLGRLVPGSCWVLYLRDVSEDVLRCRFASGLAADAVERLRIPLGEGASGWAARHRAAVLNARATADFEAAGDLSGGRVFRAALSYPLVEGDELIGALTVYHVDAEPFHDDHRHVLDHISGQVASVLRNAIVFERMRDVSFTDPLTDLPNSRALAEFLRQRVGQGSGETSYALIMIDLDDFKSVNDGHGHQTGDAALNAVASTIRGHVRGSDFCARYGGDEFVVVLHGCDRAEADRRARDLQSAVHRLRLQSGARPVPLGISVGVSMFPEDGPTIDALIAAADREMYVDKSRRRRDATVA